MENSWISSTRGSWVWLFCQKQISCRCSLRIWSKNLRGDPTQQIRSLQEKLASLDFNGGSNDLLAKRKSIILELDLLWKKDEVFLGQRFKNNWLNYGDRNSSFFHVVTMKRRNINRIIWIQDESGCLIKDKNHMSSHIMGFFQNLFCSAGPRDLDIALSAVTPHVSANTNRNLLRLVTRER